MAGEGLPSGHFTNSGGGRDQLHWRIRARDREDFSQEVVFFLHTLNSPVPSDARTLQPHPLTGEAGLVSGLTHGRFGAGDGNRIAYLENKSHRTKALPTLQKSIFANW